MAIIYTYPVKSVPSDQDLILISDSTSTNPKKKTKQITVASIKGLTAGVSSIIAGNNITISSTGQNGTGDVTIDSSAVVQPGGAAEDVQFKNSLGNFDGNGYFTLSSILVQNGVPTRYRRLRLGQTDSDGVFTGLNQAGRLELRGSRSGTGGYEGGSIVFYNEDDEKRIIIKGSREDSTVAENYQLTLPAAAPTSANKILESNASGLLSWINTPTGGGTVTSVTASSPIGSTGGTAPVISLAASGVVAGSYTHSNITVSDKGLVTAASNGVLGYTPIDYAAADTTVTGSNANKAHAYQATPDSTFTCSRAKIMLNRIPSFSTAIGSGITVGIYTRVSTGIGTGAGNILLGQGSKSVWASDPYGSITLAPVNPGDLDLVGGVAYVIVVRCIGANAATGLLGVSGITDVLLGADFASATASLPATINSELAIGTTTFRPAITLHSA